ncbi:hypothetical protein BJF85_13650 [Saccharomonospora sp. CUA-673]|uniref:hypothetical protein n=1 Tax=Saccharomonospora sp. CUA-673 TaxID=1904969 RepID=UPI00095E9E77|nr:hypothetical protein [Saccharomonospora sp. CUA-673]OLT48252.1 hypothetical protein BJF85_13650 [Saccharomonospora sp. CUA-673]
MGRNRRHGHSDDWHADEGALDAIVRQLNNGSEDINSATDKELGPVDAGVTSDVVGQALKDVLELATVVSATMSNAAENVNIAQGSYEDIENDHKGKIDYQRQEMESGPERTGGHRNRRN